MKFDVSELKTLQECGRKWQYTSRNAFHLRPKVANPNLSFGSLFHECMAAMYTGGDLDKIISQALKEVQHDSTQMRVLENMLRGYYDEVLQHDLDRYLVLDIEHAVSYYIPNLIHYDPETGEINDELSVRVVGSIDMVCLEIETRQLWGFEHKSAAKFRPSIYCAMDEQPRVYYIELMNYVEMINSGRRTVKGIDVKRDGPITLGGIYINEVKKVQRRFEYARTPCTYSPEQIARFWIKLENTAIRLQRLNAGLDLPDATPSYMSCQMCDMSSICETYQYEDVPLNEMLEEFGEEFEVREFDHLDEKAERKINT